MLESDAKLNICPMMSARHFDTFGTPSMVRCRASGCAVWKDWDHPEYDTGSCGLVSESEISIVGPVDVRDDS